MRALVTALLTLIPSARDTVADAQTPLRIIADRRPPGRLRQRAGGVAAMWAALGHKVKFVSVTNGDAGHRPKAAARWPAAAGRGRGVGAAARHRVRRPRQPRRRAAARSCDVANRSSANPPVARRPRARAAAERLPPRSPLHRRPGPGRGLHGHGAEVAPDTPASAARTRCSCTSRTASRSRAPSAPTWRWPSTMCSTRRSDALDAHVSQLYEWLPWHDGKLDQVPKDPAARKAWLKQSRNREISPSVRDAVARCTARTSPRTRPHVESFEVCEYGARPDEARLKELFPLRRRHDSVPLVTEKSRHGYGSNSDQRGHRIRGWNPEICPT